ncbi:NADH-quinone oxidoreductase subunit J [uncultured Desulfobacter sp.]|uniref:NADH-quinone oxidoreductase subunit J family protein n=1 Tax=uncultured Desulfobacter sp. TaxID=240139 RepID=UPI002AAA8C16|nr:NADH-quinone oxidoreductase subunit J [uncultured Desulfobacter sp.]
MPSANAYIFHAFAAIIIISTVMAVTRKNMVHAVLYLVVSFIGSGLLFYFLGAPLPAAFEVIIYAGAVMVLFLFIIMMLKFETSPRKIGQTRYYAAALGMWGLYLILCVGAKCALSPQALQTLEPAMAAPKNFGRFLFQQHWLSIEIISILLLVVLIGILQLELGPKRRKTR